MLNLNQTYREYLDGIERPALPEEVALMRTMKKVDELTDVTNEYIKSNLNLIRRIQMLEQRVAILESML